MIMPQKLSVYLPIHNEEKRLAACLERLSFADEIVVVLDKCTDSSKEIAQKFGAKLVEGSWQIEAPRRNAGIEACTGDWVMEIDADEHVPPELGLEIKQLINTTTADLHCVPLDNYIGTTLVRYGWGAYIGVSQKISLFRKPAKRYTGDRVNHAHVAITGTFGPVLQHRITHYLDDDLSDTLRRFDRYTTQLAKDLLAANLIYNGKPETFGKNLRRIFSRFYKCYVRRHGYREGAIGFLIAVLGGLYPMVGYIKAKHGWVK